MTSLVGTQASTKKKVEDSVQAIAARITESDRFVFYFAGHGKNQRTQGLDVAYLIVPGGRNTNDPASLISTGDVVRYSHLLDRARHQLFIFDSCYAGLMGNFQEVSSESKPLGFDSEDFLVRDLSNRRVRQYLSAGGEDQEVLDNGPQQLSWFTYFLRKGLEPGEVSRRNSGLMTFSELASYVQAMSANPKHTPAFGTLAGNQGGEFLFLTTAQGSPKLPLLPTINRQILLDMGFLTRGSPQPASVGLNIDRMREPIDQLFQAWLQKSVDLYLRQLDRRIVQTGQFEEWHHLQPRL